LCRPLLWTVIPPEPTHLRLLSLALAPCCIRPLYSPAGNLACISSVLRSDCSDAAWPPGWVQVRVLKSQQAPKPEIEAAVTCLLALKQEYKALTGEEAVAIVKKAPNRAWPPTNPASS